MHWWIIVLDGEETHWILCVIDRWFHHGLGNLTGAQAHKRIISTLVGDTLRAMGYRHVIEHYLILWAPSAPSIACSLPPLFARWCTWTNIAHGLEADLRPECVFSHPWDMGGQSPSAVPSFGAVYRLIFHQETNETSTCALEPLWSTTWWFTWTLRGHPLMHHLWSPLSHLGTDRT